MISMIISLTILLIGYHSFIKPQSFIKMRSLATPVPGQWHTFLAELTIKLLKLDIGFIVFRLEFRYCTYVYCKVEKVYPLQTLNTKLRTLSDNCSEIFSFGNITISPRKMPDKIFSNWSNFGLRESILGAFRVYNLRLWVEC